MWDKVFDVKAILNFVASSIRDVSTIISFFNFLIEKMKKPVIAKKGEKPDYWPIDTTIPTV